MKTITYDDTLYQLVPKEPTIEQQDAMVDAYFDTRDVVAVYKAGLSAAPTPPAQPAERKFADVIQPDAYLPDGSLNQKYTQPADRKPLTDEQIDMIWATHTSIENKERQRQAFARAIEAARGIKGES